MQAVHIPKNSLGTFPSDKVGKAQIRRRRRCRRCPPVKRWMNEFLLRLFDLLCFSLSLPPSVLSYCHSNALFCLSFPLYQNWLSVLILFTDDEYRIYGVTQRKHLCNNVFISLGDQYRKTFSWYIIDKFFWCISLKKNGVSPASICSFLFFSQFTQWQITETKRERRFCGQSGFEYWASG